MPTRLNPYIHFQGNAREAMEFYRAALGGELTVSTFAEGGMPHDPGDAQKLMHAQLDTLDGEVLMAADTPAGQPSGRRSPRRSPAATPKPSARKTHGRNTLSTKEAAPAQGRANLALAALFLGTFVGRHAPEVACRG
jgi:uncharacterized glyoxalase superfamily protein PhnB